MAVTPDGIFSQTLQSIIDAKLAELVKKRDVFETTKSDVLRSVEQESDSVDQLKALLAGVKRCFKIQTSHDGSLYSNATKDSDMFELLENLERFLQHACYDKSLSASLRENWRLLLMKQLDNQSARYDYASLYANLVTEWLTSEKNARNLPVGDDLEMTDSFEELDSAAKMKARLLWEKNVFEPFKTDTHEIKSFLSTLFGEGTRQKKHVKQALDDLRASVAAFERNLAISNPFDHGVIRWAIEGLLAGELMTGDKRMVLKDFLNNDIILGELVDVLNLRMTNLEEWDWGETVQVEQRRRVAGHYSIHMHEELLQAIFLQFMGAKWAVFFRQTFATFVDSTAVWRPDALTVSPIDRERRLWYLGGEAQVGSLQSKRHHLWRSKYFLTQLPKIEWQQLLTADGTEEADYATSQRAQAPTPGNSTTASLTPMQQQQQQQQMQGMMYQQQMAAMGPMQQHPSMMAPDSSRVRTRRELMMPSESAKKRKRVAYHPGGMNDDSDKRDHDHSAKQLMDLKQGLLHMLRAEIIINTRIHGGLTAVRCQFGNWNTLLPHSTIMMVLTYLGLSRKWLKFMQSFLQAPLGFAEEGKVEPPRSRQRGVPGSHPLSDALGETILFCMDFFVNQECQGTKLWRMYDDIWFWSPDTNLCTRVWTSVKKFSDLFGLIIDNSKAGAAVIGASTTSASSSSDVSELPRNPIRWGFLYLDSKTGQFEIDQSLVDDNIRKLKEQLKEKSVRGVLPWIQAWNAYAINFFSTNFGQPANCFGAEHIKNILSTLERMQKQVFGDETDDSNVVKFLQNVISKRFGIHDVPEGYCFFPAELGGLAVRNPFISPLQFINSTNFKQPEKYLDTWENAEREAYETFKQAFDRKIAQNQLHQSYQQEYKVDPKIFNHPEEIRTFFSFEEFTRYREVLSCPPNHTDTSLRGVLVSLLDRPEEEAITITKEVQDALERMDTTGNMALSDISPNKDMKPYWAWITQMYGPEIISKFGGLQIVDNGVLPIGMVSLVRSDRVSWSG